MRRMISRTHSSGRSSNFGYTSTPGYKKRINHLLLKHTKKIDRSDGISCCGLEKIRKYTSLILICVAICWIRSMVSTWPFHKISLPNGFPQHFWFSWFTIFCSCIANPLSTLKFCWLSLTAMQQTIKFSEPIKWKILSCRCLWLIKKEKMCSYHVRQLLRAFAVAFVGRCPVNWQFLYLIPVNVVMSTHIETFVDHEPMIENLNVSQLRQVHWNRLFHVYTVLWYGNGAEFPFQYHQRLAQLMSLTCK